MPNEFFAVITTIREPSKSSRRLVSALRSIEYTLIVVGDRKSPEGYDLPGAEFLTLKEQERLPFSISGLLPTDHYSRKNLGYLIAISRGAKSIYETDDDNEPNEHWFPRSKSTKVQKVNSKSWCNVYKIFSKEMVWPRGFPLNRIHETERIKDYTKAKSFEIESPIQQGLVDVSPDVDAIWRFIFDRPIRFERHQSVWLPPGSWCPFNSQTTWWWPDAYPLLYLPSFCTSRVTDTWRSFVAQRCLWEIDCGVVFHPSEVSHHRYAHDLMQDFEEELPGYKMNDLISRELSELTLQPGKGAVARNLLHCYERLVEAGFLPEAELRVVKAWLEDLERNGS